MREDNQYIFDFTWSKESDFINATVENIIILDGKKYGDVTLRNGKTVVVKYNPLYATWFPTLKPRVS